MESKSYENFDVEPSGKIFCFKSKEYLLGKTDRHNEIRFKFSHKTELVKAVMCRLFFDFDEQFQSLLKIWHIDQDNHNLDLYNLKLFPRNDKFNVSGIYIAFNSEDKICTFNRFGEIKQFDNVRDAYVSIILNE